MLEPYLHAVFEQLRRRARSLRARIPRNLPQEYDALVRKATDMLDGIFAQLDAPDGIGKSITKTKIRRMRRIVGELDRLESLGVPALERAALDDHRLNALLQEIRDELGYPLLRPTVSTLSQQYYCIDTQLNLMLVPFQEARFLLHLPDLYHELAHPLARTTNDPVIEPFQAGILQLWADVRDLFEGEQRRADRGRSPASVQARSRLWETLWTKYWMEEFFCDVFAANALGPAYAWSHLNLCAQRGAAPYAVPPNAATSHPADDARMKVVLEVLRLRGWNEASEDITQRWGSLCGEIGSEPMPEFRQCYPNQLLRGAAEYACEACDKIGCKPGTSGKLGRVGAMLNEAWEHIWTSPGEFGDWEERAVQTLFAPHAKASRAARAAGATT